MTKAVLVTGGAGFIGSNLTKRLLNNKLNVICIDNLSSFYDPKTKLKNIQEFKNNTNFHFYKIDILNKAKVRSILKRHKVSIVIHLAAQPGTRLSFIKPQLYEQTNIAGTYNLLDVIKDFNISQFIFASSSSVYGNSKVPFNEEKSQVKPISLYGATKLAGENACFAYHKNFNIPTTILRFFSVYGPKGRPDMAPYLFTKALFSKKPIKIFGDGQSSRDWTYIDDIVEGIYMTINKPQNFEIVNLGNNKPVKLIKLIHTIEQISGLKFKKILLPKREDEPEKTYADSSKAKRLYSWKATVNMEEGIKKFIDWYKSEVY